MNPTLEQMASIEDTQQKTDNLIKVAQQTAYLNAANLMLQLDMGLALVLSGPEFRLHLYNLMMLESAKLNKK